METPSRDDIHQDDSFEAIGAELSCARIAQGMQIAEVAQLLRIPKHYLKDIEAGSFDQLPGPTYVSGYLRSYARVVGLDAVALTNRYRELLNGETAAIHYKFPVDNQHPQRSGAMVASIIVMFAIVGYGGWYAMGKPDLTGWTGNDEAVVANNVVEEAASKGGTPAAIISADSGLDVADVDAFTGALETDGETGADVASTSLVEDDAQALRAEGGTADLAATAITESPTFAETGLSADPGSVDLADSTQTDPGQTGSGQTDSGQTDSGQTVSDQTDGAINLQADAALQSSQTPVTQTASLAESDPAAPTSSTGSAEDTPAVADASAVLPNTITPAQDLDSESSLSGVAYAGQPDMATEITIRATGTSWVEIIRNNGEEVMTRLMRDGDIFTIDGRERLYLSTGNAGGIELVFSDGLTKSVGEKGEILRDLPLDAERLRNQL